MRRILILPAVLLVSLACFSQPKPGKPAFIVNYEESGRYADESWSYSAVVKFSLSNWSEPLRGRGYTPEERKLPLEFDPGAFLKLQPGAVVKFYPSEIDEAGSGTNGSYTRILGTDGVETTVEITDQGTRTKVTDDATFRKGNNIPTNENFMQNARYYQLGNLAELERTATGGILRAYTAIGNNLSQWAVSMETEEQVFPGVHIFVLTDTEIRSWKQISKTSSRNGSSDDDNLSVTVAVRMDVPDLVKPEVTLYGCSELGTGEQIDVMASGKPEGGKFRFWVEPGSLLNVQHDGESSAILTGATPGKGTLYVEYTNAEGETSTASQPASYVKIDNYNGGQQIPQIALFDIDGKKLPGVLKIPVAAQPSNLEELVDFVAADKSVLSVVGLPGAVELTGSKEGNTTFQAKTNCGHATGPTVEVEVVNCDKETVEALDRMMKAAIENLQDAAANLQKVAGSKEFEKARDDLPASAGDLLAKAALTIISSGKSPSGAVNTATSIAEAGEAISEMIASGSRGEFFENTAKTAFKEINGKIAGALVGVGEVYHAAKRFGENAGEVLKHEAVLKSARENWDKADKDFQRIEKLQQICKGDKTEPQKTEEPKADPTPEPTDPKPPVDPKPKTDTPPAKDPPTGDPEPPEPGDEEPPISPPPPTSEPRQVGLPYSPGECGCDKAQGVTPDTEGLSTLQAGIKNIGECVENFNSVSVNDYLNTLNELSAVTDKLNAAADGDPAIFEVKAKEVKPQLDSLIERTKAYDVAGQTFMKQFEKCPESVTTGMDVLNSAITVTVDSVKTKY